MAKAIFVMDMPERCNDCYALHMSQNGLFCRAAKEHLQPKAEKPDWCPLRELPEEKEELPVEKYEFGGLGKAFTSGWNACLDEILERKE